MTHFFYLARCADKSLYAGTCVDLAKREQKHNDGSGAKYRDTTFDPRTHEYSSLVDAVTQNVDAIIEELRQTSRQKTLDFDSGG